MSNTEWYFANDSRVRDADNKPTGEPNVTGRFEDYPVIDGPASKAARKNVYRTGILLKSRVSVSSMGTASTEEAGKVLEFDHYPEEAQAAIKRFPEAWTAYQKYRKAPLQAGEAEVLEDMGLRDTVKKRGPKAKTSNTAKVVPIKSEVA